MRSRRDVVSVALPFVLGIAVSLLVWAGPDKGSPTGLAFPPEKPDVVEYLSDEIGVYGTTRWRGSLLTLNGVSARRQGGALGWGDIAGRDVAFWLHMGNDLRAIGLWWYGIPTVFEYNQLMSPFYYALAVRSLATRREVQQRSIMVLSKAHEGVLRTLGVRFVLADRPINPQGGLVSRKRFPIRPGMKTPDKEVIEQVLLYEVPETNTGTFAPVDIQYRSTATAILQVLHKPGFDPARTAVLERKISKRLVAPNSIDFNFSRTGITLRVETDGESLIVLPLQYSHCLRTGDIQTKQDNVAPRLLRANLALTGVLVHGPTNLSIAFRNGPFESPYCRFRDIADGKRIGLGDLSSYWP